MSLIKGPLLLFLDLLLLKGDTYISILFNLCPYSFCKLITRANLSENVLSEIVAIIVSANLFLTLLKLAQVLLKLC